MRGPMLHQQAAGLGPMSRLQQLVHDRLNLQIVRHGTSFNGLTSQHMIHQTWVQAAVYGIR